VRKVGGPDVARHTWGAAKIGVVHGFTSRRLHQLNISASPARNITPCWAFFSCTGFTCLQPQDRTLTTERKPCNMHIAYI